MKSTPTVRAIARDSSWQGFPSRMRFWASGDSRKAGLWNFSMVRLSTRPGQIDFRPPESPAMKWLSTSPVAILRSAR